MADQRLREGERVRVLVDSSGLPGHVPEKGIVVELLFHFPLWF